MDSAPENRFAKTTPCTVEREIGVVAVKVLMGGLKLPPASFRGATQSRAMMRNSASEKPSRDSHGGLMDSGLAPSGVPRNDSGESLLRLRDLGRLGGGDEAGCFQHRRPERRRHFQPERDQDPGAGDRREGDLDVVLGGEVFDDGAVGDV